MITKIDIKNFGLFSNYRWELNIGNTPEDTFKRVNIIYGRNYSGKTTLSRVMKCIEDGKLHEKYTDGEFRVTNADGSISSNINLISPYNIRVYNTDFVRENLKFLYDENGDIEPFTLLGSENQDIQDRINEITNLLGGIESGNGLLFDMDTGKKVLETTIKELDEKESTLNDKLKYKANREIKINPNLIKQGDNYNVNNIQREIDRIIDFNTSFVLTETEKENNRVVINEQAKPDISEISATKFKFTERVTNTREIVQKKISITNTIQELINDAALQSWVEKGRNLHKGTRDKCVFCGNDITSIRWEEIDAHFSKESEELKAQIATEIKLLEESKLNLQTFLEDKGIRKDNFYSTLHSEYDRVNSQWNLVSKKYTNSIEQLLSALCKRDAEIFNIIALEEIEDNSEHVLSVIKQFNELVKKHNSKTAQLERDKDQSRKKLRFSDIESFIDDIDYKTKKKVIADCKKKNTRDQALLEILSERIDALESEKKEKEHALKDEGTAALKVNELLSRFFGHNGLKLDPETTNEEGTPKTNFIIKRGSEKAHNLSEGECSLIAFCYFIAKMDDELKGADSGRLLIYIDDPISSLDNNHIFFMFSLIESIICKEMRYGQLFISTHNLEFLKYTKKLTVPKGPNNSKLISHYNIVREQKCDNVRSLIIPMSHHLRENITEYTFLFKEIYSIILPVYGDKARRIENTYTQFYNLANNMRKFLECYLYYRYPNTDNPLNNLDRLFEYNTPALVNRVINEGSHLAWGDRGTLPLDVAEAESVAKEILKAIKNRDQSHFDSLCESVGVDKNIAL